MLLELKYKLDGGKLSIELETLSRGVKAVWKKNMVFR